jgi:hypothetical protein
MCRRALESSPWISLSSWEASQDAWSPTLNVLTRHREVLNDRLGKYGSMAVGLLGLLRIWYPHHRADPRAAAVRR